MKKQIHRRLSKEQIIVILEHYLSREISSDESMKKLSIGKTRFFELVGGYKEKGDNFKIKLKRKHSPNKLSKEKEGSIIKELKKEKKLIENKNITIKNYNYSAVRDLLLDKHNINVSVPTIISRAKENGFYLEKRKRERHDREVITSFSGELVQHDSSHHLWSPYMDDKLYLITSLDDYSRLMLYADVFEKETTWRHIDALKSVFLQYGRPLKYYADQHSIFRYVKSRDTESNYVNYTKFTDDVDTQWKRVLRDCDVDVIYALSPQAKGKIERPYRWLQDRIVRTAAKEKLTTISEIRDVLKDLVDKYNNKWIHSTTKEIPIERFEKTLDNDLCLFKPLQQNTNIDDIFCIKLKRKADGYGNVYVDNIKFSFKKVLPRQYVDVHIVPDVDKGIVELRFWQNGTFLDRRIMKLSVLKMVRF